MRPHFHFEEEDLHRTGTGKFAFTLPKTQPNHCTRNLPQFVDNASEQGTTIGRGEPVTVIS